MVKTVSDGVDAAVAKNKPREELDPKIFANVSLVVMRSTDHIPDWAT